MNEDFERQHPHICRALIDAAAFPPDHALSERIMGRVTEHAQGRALLGGVRPPTPSSTFCDAVMRRVRSRAAQGDLAHAQPSSGNGGISHRRLRSIFTHTAVAASVAAAILLSSTFLGPSSAPQPANLAPGGDFAEVRNAGSVAPTLVPDSAMEPAFARSATLLFSREFDGRKCWVLNAGLAQGVRDGDIFEWREGGRETPSCRLRVVGLGGAESICRLEEVVTGAEPKAGDRAVRAYSHRAAQATASAGQPVFTNIGATVSASDRGVMVREVFNDLWATDQPRPAASRAFRLGLRRGDRIVSVAGQPVRDASDVADALTDAPSHASGVVVCVDRGGSEMTLYER